MNLTLYSLLGYLLLPIMLLRLVLKSIKTPQYILRINERLGLIKSTITPVIWIHCVSVGEFRASIVLIDALIKKYPNYTMLITSTTLSGSKAVINYYQNKVLHYYFPFDIPVIVKRYIRQIKPVICLLLETEIWPNLIHFLHKNKIPSLLINARLSSQSFTKYQKFSKNLTQQTINKLTMVATQNQNSADFFVKLGIKQNKVINTGNIKFDQKINIDKQLNQQLKTIISNRKTLVFASTHADEEASIINSYLKFKNKIDELLIIIPRHPERFNMVYQLAQNAELNIVRRTSNNSSIKADIILGDSMGEMMNYFDVGDVVFMGGSLSNTGGHNMLEPAALGKPILFGPNVFNFAEISSNLLKTDAAIQVQNTDELLTTMSALAKDKNKTKVLGNNANQYFKSGQGATQVLIRLIKHYL